MGRNNRNRSSNGRAGSSDSWFQATWSSPFDQRSKSNDSCYTEQQLQQLQDYDMTCLANHVPQEVFRAQEMNLDTITDPVTRKSLLHPILFQRNFQVSRAEFTQNQKDVREVFEDCPGLNYRDLKQVWHLASYFLVVSIPFFHTIFEGKVKQVINAPTRSYEFVETNETFVLGGSRQKTEKLLEDLARYVKFEVNQDPDAASCTVEGEDIQGNGHEFKNGKHSIIYLSQQKVANAMVSAHKADPLFKAAAFFDLARDIVHELAYAAVFAARGNYWRPTNGESSWSKVKFFFNGNPVADAGLELEHRLLGGRIEFVHEEATDYYVVNGRPSSFRYKMVSRDRPSQNIRCVYDDLSCKAGLRAQHAPFFEAYYVLPSHICELFQADFWHKVGANNNQIPPLRTVYAVEYRYPTSPVDHYAPLDSPRLAQEAGWCEAECRPMMQLEHISSNGLPRGFSESLRVLPQRQEVMGTEDDQLMDIDGGFLYVGHGDPKVVQSEVFEVNW